MPSTQITIRHVDRNLAERLKALSSQRGESLNSTVLHLLRDAVGIDERRERLMRYATWDDGDARELDDALRAQRTVEAADWQ